jgi:hypothetical protein
MRHLKSFLVAALALGASSSLFATIVVNPTYTYDLSTSTPGWSGSITLDSSSGAWIFGVSQGDPIVSFDIVTPVDTFDSSNPNVSVVFSSNPPPSSIMWTSSGITSLNLTIYDSDPFSLSMVGPGPGLSPDITFTVTGDATASAMGSFSAGSVPDDFQTWLLLAGVCAALGTHRVLSRRGMKTC